jgi:hypothetical protein
VPKLAYLLAASHSGSTLLAMLLGAHPEACTVGELKATSLGDPNLYLCSCGQKIKECAFWKQVSQAMARRGIAGFDITQAGTSIYEARSRYAQCLLAPLHRGPGLEFLRDLGLFFSPAWRAHLRESQRRSAALVEVLQEIRAAKVVVDSSKVALRLKYLLNNPTLEIKVIHLIRDGRAVAMTYTDEWSFADARDPTLRGGGTGLKRDPPRQNMAEAANEWKRSNEAADCLLRGLPTWKWTRVSYEDLCQDPAGVLRRLCEFLELDPGKIVLNFRSCPQHVIGNGMRLDKGCEIRVDERWKSSLSSDQLRAFDIRAGSLNRHYGYE